MRSSVFGFFLLFDAIVHVLCVSTTDHGWIIPPALLCCSERQCSHVQVSHPPQRRTPSTLGRMPDAFRRSPTRRGLVESMLPAPACAVSGLARSTACSGHHGHHHVQQLQQHNATACAAAEAAVWRCTCVEVCACDGPSRIPPSTRTLSTRCQPVSSRASRREVTPGAGRARKACA